MLGHTLSWEPDLNFQLHAMIWAFPILLNQPPLNWHTQYTWKEPVLPLSVGCLSPVFLCSSHQSHLKMEVNHQDSLVERNYALLDLNPTCGTLIKFLS